MTKDPQVDLIFSHFIPRYIATGVDANDIDRLVASIDTWSEWCRENNNFLYDCWFGKTR